MASIDLVLAEQQARRAYELARVRQAVLGALPSAGLVSIAALLASRPTSTVSFGGALVLLGIWLLWRGKEAGRAVLPGLVAGLVPLALSICANRIGHYCDGERCVALCLPACALGGTVAGVVVAAVAARKRYGWHFWVGASAVSLLTGAMGCSCVGFSGVFGLGAGFALAAGVAMVRRRLRAG